MNYQDDDFKQFCVACVQTWGERDQIDMLQEEMGELLVAAAHIKRDRPAMENFIEELADVELMCQQMRVIIDNLQMRTDPHFDADKAIETVAKQKIERTWQRIKQQAPSVYEVFKQHHKAEGQGNGHEDTNS